MTASRRCSRLGSSALLLGLCPALRADPLLLADQGRSDYRLVLPADPFPSEKYAAGEFQRFFKELSGAELPIGTEADPPAGHEICLNARDRIASADPEFAKTVPGRDGFAVRTKGTRLLVLGDRPRGTLYAVYTLLEERFGCRWFTRDVSRIPKQVRWELPALDFAYAPPLEYREDFWSEAFDGDWAARHRLNGNHHRLEERHGGKITYDRFVHTFDSILSPKDHFAAHPEYFAEVNGKRCGDHPQRTQLCLTNPDVLRLTIETVKRWIAEKPQATIFSVSQNDCDNHCTCAACRAIDEREGSPMGALLTFVNAVAEAIGKDHPDKLIDTLAYQYSRKPPKTLRPLPNVRVRLCSIECCFAHTLAECGHNRSFREDIRGWSKITDKLYVWDYTTNFANYLMPFPNFDVLGPNVRFYVEHGVKGLFEQGNYSNGGGGEMSELRAYVLAKVLWNPQADPARAIGEFTDAVYGEAGPKVREYLELLHGRVRPALSGVEGAAPRKHVAIFSKPDAPHLMGDFLDRAETLFAEGLALVKDDAARKRLLKARIPLDYLHLIRTPAGEERAKRLEVFVAVCKEFGITNVSEGQSVADFEKNMR